MEEDLTFPTILGIEIIPIATAILFVHLKRGFSTVNAKRAFLKNVFHYHLIFTIKYILSPFLQCHFLNTVVTWQKRLLPKESGWQLCLFDQLYYC